MGKVKTGGKSRTFKGKGPLSLGKMQEQKQQSPLKSSNRDARKRIYAAKQAATRDGDASFDVVPVGKRKVVMIARLNSSEDGSTLPMVDKDVLIERITETCSKFGQVDGVVLRGQRLAFVQFLKPKEAEKCISKLDGSTDLGSAKGLMLSMSKRSLEGLIAKASKEDKKAEEKEKKKASVKKAKAKKKTNNNDKNEKKKEGEEKEESKADGE